MIMELASVAQKPPTRYEQLMRLLLAFYNPYHVHERLQQDIRMTLKIAHATIMDQPTAPGEEIKLLIVEAMLRLWQRARHETFFRHARGSALEVRAAIQEYADFYYDVIFCEMAQGERAMLKHRFESLAGACWVIYTDLYRQQREPLEPNNAPTHIQHQEPGEL